MEPELQQFLDLFGVTDLPVMLGIGLLAGALRTSSVSAAVSTWCPVALGVAWGIVSAYAGAADATGPVIVATVLKGAIVNGGISTVAGRIAGARLSALTNPTARE